ncbi:hypothetical protein BU16DRAFT_528868 [Lophium mytilinum]|uniref:YDG domain-containing protein n=1 Tax=Lophium mytilinum TaxID=390894 RepID=A0A6A6QMJ6_9PEZI|nr:hypothetical protein BU16DRAFT_528868 [Lophium mytilinum]
MDYDYYEDMAKRRKAFRAKWPDESPSPPPAEVPRAVQPMQPNRTQPYEIVDLGMSSPESIPQSPPPNPLKRPRANNTDVTMTESPTDEARQPPEWYNKLRIEAPLVKASRKDTRNGPTLAKISGIKGACKTCEEAPMGDLTEQFVTLRNLIHDMEFLTVDQYLIRATRMLENRIGLPRIFDLNFTKGVNYPWDIKLDAEQLHTRWCRGVFSIDILHGIKRAYNRNRDGQRNADKIDPEYKKRLYANHYGQGNLINGQWWPTQLCTLRDGAHGSAQGGIFGEKNRGTYSIVVSGGHKYGDKDEGEEIWYTGTDGTDETPTENTKRLFESCEMPENEKEPVRVIRSWNLNKENKYRPAGGFRYDGLYDVVESEPVNKNLGMYKFLLVRRAGQDPIRFEGVEMRPTQQELNAYKKLQQDDRI